MRDSVYKFVSYGFVRGRLDGVYLEHEYGPAIREPVKPARPEVDQIKLKDDDSV